MEFMVQHKIVVGFLALVFGVVSIFLLVTKARGSQKKPEVANNQVQGVETTVTSDEGLPKLEIFQAGIALKLPDSETFVEGKDGQEIPVGTILKTDATGRAQVLYPNGSVTRVDFNSQMQLEEFSNNGFQAKVKLSSGRIWSRVVKLLGKESFQTESQNLVASIRGTSFGHGILANGSDRLLVTKGNVQGDCANQTQSGLVTFDRKAVFSCKKGEKAATAPLDASDKDEWYRFNLAEDQKLDQRFGKDRYADEIAKSPTPTPRPSATPKSTPSPAGGPTATPTTTPNSNPTPTATPTSTLTPTPVVVIRQVGSGSNGCNTSSCEVNITGTGLDMVKSADVIDQTGKNIATTTSFEPVSTNQTYAYFTGLPTGSFYIRIGSVLSPNTFTVGPFLQ